MPTILLAFVTLLADPVQTTPKASLFDGKSLTGWKITDFGGRGKCVSKRGISSSTWEAT